MARRWPVVPSGRARRARRRAPPRPRPCGRRRPAGRASGTRPRRRPRPRGRRRWRPARRPARDADGAGRGGRAVLVRPAERRGRRGPRFQGTGAPRAGPGRASQPGQDGGGPACWRIQVCMAMPDATPALIERVEPYWLIEQTRSTAPRTVGGQARPLLAEDERAALGQLDRLERHRAGEVVDPDERHLPRPSPTPTKSSTVGWCAHVLVAIGDHRAPSVPAAPPDDVDLRRRGRRWRCARPSRCSCRAASSRWRRGTGCRCRSRSATMAAFDQ